LYFSHYFTNEGCCRDQFPLDHLGFDQGKQYLDDYMMYSWLPMNWMNKEKLPESVQMSQKIISERFKTIREDKVVISEAKDDEPVPVLQETTK